MGANVDASAVAVAMPNFVRQIQRERMGRATMQPVQNVNGAQEFQNLLNVTNPNAQQEDAASTPGALQEQGGEERGRQRDVRQTKTPSSLG